MRFDLPEGTIVDLLIGPLHMATSRGPTSRSMIMPSGRPYISSRSLKLRLGCGGDMGGVMLYTSPQTDQDSNAPWLGGGGGLAAGAAGGVVCRHRARQHLRQLDGAGGEDGDGHLLRQVKGPLDVGAMALGLHH